MPPVLHPHKNSSALNIVSGKLIKAKPRFETNFTSSYVTPITYNFRIPLDRTVDHYFSYAALQMSQLIY